MKEVTIRRYHAEEGGRWLELWLDGEEYDSDETVWDHEKDELVKTGDKKWNFCCKLGNFIQDYFDQTGDTISFGYNFEKVIGMKVYLPENEARIYFRNKEIEVKNKAKELVEKYYNKQIEVLNKFGGEEFVEVENLIAIECAKITVDEIIESGNNIISELIDEYEDLEFNNYWQEVKNELNNM